ncbi:MAG TPA: hypothetical protein VNA66_11800, partial [Gammaproteobacteria bacterium]|nr:hypothetical protein [Gammaproteobacteria bacterium]
MNRRDFIASGTAVAASSVVAVGELGAQPARAAECVAPPAGVQLFTVREALGRDLRGALLALHDIGIVEAELFGLNGPESATLFGLRVDDVKRAFEENGIRVPISHIGGDLTNTKAIADIAHTLGLEAVCVALPSEFSGAGGMVPASNRAQLDALAEKLNRVGREYRDRGLTFGYHNHHVEFIRVDGVVPYDYLMSNTDPSLVKIEL